MKNKDWITYWKKNLSDTLKSHIDINTLFHFEIKNFNMKQECIYETAEINHLIDTEELRINKKSGIKIFKNNIWLSIKQTHVLIAPLVIKEKEQSLTYDNDPNLEIPFWYFAKIDRNGNLNVPDETSPIFQLEFLKYITDESPNFYLDKFEETHNKRDSEKKEFKNYAQYIHYLQNTYKDTTGQEIGNSTSRYNVINNGIVLLPHLDILLLLKLINLIENIKP